MEKFSRAATLEDLRLLLHALDDHGVEYILIGGYALAAHGYQRATTDIDLLVPATFVIFGAGDVVGRLIASVTPRLGARPLLAFCNARIVLVPLLLVCNMVPDSGRWALPRSLGNDDVAPVVLLALLAVSNGFAFSVAFAAGPACVPAAQRGGVAQTLVACLVLGVVLGSITSLLFSVALQAK